LLVIKRAFEAAIPVAMAELANRLWSQRDNAGNPRRADAFYQLQQRQGSEDDPNLLHSTTQQFTELFLILRGDFNTQSWTTHTPSMRPNIS
jgi:hypothetical protein